MKINWKDIHNLFLTSSYWVIIIILNDLLTNNTSLRTCKKFGLL